MSEERGLSGKFLDYLKETISERLDLGTIAKETGQMLDHKIAQGAAELGQALNSQADGYVPYGAGQAPLEVEGPATSYQDMLREASQPAGQEQDREMER
jgi:hypothetical protein